MMPQAVVLAERAIVKSTNIRCGGHTGAQVHVLARGDFSGISSGRLAICLSGCLTARHFSWHGPHSSVSQAQMRFTGRKHQEGQAPDGAARLPSCSAALVVLAWVQNSWTTAQNISVRPGRLRSTRRRHLIRSDATTGDQG